MNIFVLDENIKKCAQYYNNKHCIKIIEEIKQMICTNHNISGTSLSKIPTTNEKIFKPCYQNHPVTKWVRESLSNYKWAVELGLELCKEYTYRYGKIHKSQKVLEWCKNNLPNILDIGLTPFAQAMPDYCKRENAIDAYRFYYMNEKRHIAQWKNRNLPSWYEEGK
jgi:hypothetical protein